MWFRLSSGTLVNLDRVDSIGIVEGQDHARSGGMPSGFRYMVRAVSGRMEDALYESDSLQDCQDILMDFEEVLRAACVDKDENGDDVLFTMDENGGGLTAGGLFKLS